MKGKKQVKPADLESVKIDKAIVEMVREHKKKTYIPIGEFFKLAAIEKLKSQSK